jgi:UDP-N-acetylmuramoylalanine--D-glutamate ligase
MSRRFELSGRKVLVLGLGDTGLSCLRWLAGQGCELRAADSREMPPHLTLTRLEIPSARLSLGGWRAEDFAWADLIVASPGVPLTTPEIRAALSAGKEVVGDVELFARALSSVVDRPTVLAVTGSNGKSTVTSMAGEMATVAGLRTVVAGNIGLPVLDAWRQVTEEAAKGASRPEMFVLELSSFQLETTSSLNPDAAAVLNLSEDHLDRYPDKAAYAAAKARIFLGGGTQVLNRDDALSLGMRQPDRRICTFGLGMPEHEGEWGLVAEGDKQWIAEGNQRLVDLRDIPVPGLHNAANAMAAFALCRAAGLPYPPLVEALRRFRGLPHRMDWVAEIGGVKFYDDSKGTNVGATLAALRGMPDPVVLIAGGDGKGQDFAPLAEAMDKVRAVVLIGRDADRIRSALAASGVHLENATGMDEAVSTARTLARPGDAVLLSPACASFDMFRDYHHRAQVFIAAVQALEAQEGVA